MTDVFDMEVDDDMREQIEKAARHLYGLVHARYIVTTRGLAKMVSLARHRLSFILKHRHRWTSTSKASSANARA